MELVEAVSEMDWSALNATMPVEESEIMMQLLGPYPFTSEQNHDPILSIPSMFGSELNGNSYNCSDSSNTISCYWPQVCSSTTSPCSFFSPTYLYESYNPSDSNVIPVSVSSELLNSCVPEVQITPSSIQIVPSHQFEDAVYSNEEASGDELGESNDPQGPLDQTFLAKRKLHEGEDDKPMSHKDEITTESPKKKTNTTAQSKRNMKNSLSKKARKMEAGNEEENNVALNGPNYSCCSSDDDSNASQELNGGGGTSSSSKGHAALNLNGKTRAGRGSATDPQSLYARRRRERINERLKILQSLVPNGTKVDISTMLEEAVQYVKFLQLQIKILSSDELWMYAPIAYNGMDIGLDFKISLSQ